MAIRMMDNLVDLETEALAKIIAACTDDFERDLFIKIRDVAIAARRIGLGTHGLADALACLQIKYDSEEGLAMAEGIFDVLRDESYRASIELAKVRGAFPLYNYQTDQQCAFIKRLPLDIQEDMKKYGRRNGALLTSAPTGTISILCQTSSGAEPVFANFYYRSKKINDPNQEADFIDANGVKWEQYKVRHHNVQDFLSLYPEFTDETLPEWFVTSADINWDYRLRMQKTIGDRSDGGVSSTLNLPTETSWETIRDIYMKAYDYGIKGVTVYRDGCRDGVLNITDKHSEEFYKRPEVLKCDIYHVTVKELIDEVTVPVPYVVIISLKEGKPFEIFGGKADGELLAKKQKQGEITKHKHRKTNRYELVSNGTTICDLGESFNASTYSVGNRLMSLALRNSCGVNFLIDQLLSEPDSDMNAYNRVVSRCLKNYVEDGAKSGVTCPQCGAKALRYQDKCSICMDCGFSGCS
jgi:ribonucleoside-diphosphate reductase alpha chain